MKGLAINLPINSNMSQVDMNLKKGLIVYEGHYDRQNANLVKKLKIKLTGGFSKKFDTLAISGFISGDFTWSLSGTQCA